MRYWLIWLDYFHTCIIAAPSEDAAKIIVERGKENWPKAMLGHELFILTELPEKDWK